MLCIGVLDAKNGGRRPPMPPPPGEGGTECAAPTVHQSHESSRLDSRLTISNSPVRTASFVPAAHLRPSCELMPTPIEGWRSADRRTGAAAPVLPAHDAAGQ